MKTISRRGVCMGAIALTPAHSQADTQHIPARAPLLGGVNLAGLEFTPANIPGRVDVDYVAPSEAEIAYYRGQGFRAIRLPFLWERLQPRLDGPFDDAYFDLIKTAIAQAADMYVVLDAHQFGRRMVDGDSIIIGESTHVTASHFANFWQAFASALGGDSNLIFGLVNEPHDQDSGVLISVQNQAIASIRQTGASNLILVSGNAWSGAHSWISSGNGAAMRAIVDDGDNFAFDVHQYLDARSTGAAPDCVASAGRRLEAFTRWCQSNNKRGFLGEFGASGDRQCIAALDELLAYVAANSGVLIGWTYWAGGPWWPADYPFSLRPSSLERPTPRPQMAVLRRHLQ